MLIIETKKSKPEPQRNGVGELTGLIGLDVGAQWELGWGWGFSLELSIDATDRDRIHCVIPKLRKVRGSMVSLTS